MRGRDIEGKHLDQPRQARRLAFRKLEHHPGQGRGVDDRVLERTLEAPTDKPRIKRVVAVLHEHRTLGKAQESAAGVAELRRADEHRPVDVMAPVGVRVDRSLAVYERVEEGQGAVEPEPFGPDLQYEERRVAGGLDIQRDELRLVQPGFRLDLWRVDGDLLPWHRLHRPARFQIDGFSSHRASAKARRAQPISSMVNPRSKTTAAP